MEKASSSWKSGASQAPLPPQAGGLPLLGGALGMLNNPLQYLLEQYHRLGPVYQVQAANRKFTVMAGHEANLFLSRAGDEHFGSQELFGGFAQELATDIFLVAMDGEPHRHLRKVMRRGYSREAVVPHLGRVIGVTRQFAEGWQPDQRLPVLAVMQRIVTEQLGTILVNHPPGEYFEDIWSFLNTIMRATVIKTWPSFMLRLPGYRKSKARVLELAQQVVNEHRQIPPEDQLGRPDLVDDMIAAQDENGRPLPEEAILAGTIGPYFAGIDTVASTLGFMLYALLSQPDILQRVQPEVDQLLSAGTPTLKDLKDSRSLYGTTLETLRMYPVAAFTPRTAIKPFEFSGHRVEAGTEVLVATGVTHYLPQFFPDPERFDIDRYSEPRNEHRQAGVFAPYSLGAHTCLGAGMAEVIIMLTMATLLHTVQLSLDPPDYRVRVQLSPIPSPGRKFRVRVVGQR